MLSDSIALVKSGARFVRTLGLPYAPAAVAGGFGAALARARARTRAGVVRFERFGPATNGDSLGHATRGGCTDGPLLQQDTYYRCARAGAGNTTKAT